MSELTTEHLHELIRLLGRSRNTPGNVQLPREGVNLLLDEIDRLRAIEQRLKALVERSAPFHLNQDGECGWDNAIGHVEDALEARDV